MALIRILVLLAASLALGSPAWAQYSSSRDVGWEFGLQAIYLDSTDLGFDGGTDVRVDDDLGIAMTFGYRFNARLELQFALDWATVDYNLDMQSAILPGTELNIDGELEWFTPRVNLSYNFLDGPITPYVSGGIGWSFIDTNIPTSRVEVGCWWDPWWGQICTPYQSTKDIDEFMYQAGAGVRWDINRSFGVRLGYEKRWVDFSNAESAPDFDQYTFSINFIY